MLPSITTTVQHCTKRYCQLVVIWLMLPCGKGVSPSQITSLQPRKIFKMNIFRFLSLAHRICSWEIINRQAITCSQQPIRPWDATQSPTSLLFVRLFNAQMLCFRLWLHKWFLVAQMPNVPVDCGDCQRAVLHEPRAAFASYLSFCLCEIGWV